MMSVNVNSASLFNKLKEKVEQSINVILDVDDLETINKHVQQIKNNLDTFEKSFLSHYSNRNTVEMNSIFDFIINNCSKLKSNNASSHGIMATIRRYFIQFLIVIIAVLKTNIKTYACILTDAFIENLLFSSKYNDEEHDLLFVIVVKGLRQFMLLMKSGCGIEAYVPEILQTTEKTIAISDKNEQNGKYVTEKACESLKLHQALLDYPATRYSICKYVIKTYVPIVLNLLEGCELLPFNIIECQNILRDLIVYTSLKLENSEFNLRGLVNDFLQYFINKNYDNETVASQRAFLRRIDIPIAPPLCISALEKSLVNNVFM